MIVLQEVDNNLHDSCKRIFTFHAQLCAAPIIFINIVIIIGHRQSQETMEFNATGVRCILCIIIIIMII